MITAKMIASRYSVNVMRHGYGKKAKYHAFRGGNGTQEPVVNIAEAYTLASLEKQLQQAALRETIKKMSLEQRRKRLAEINRLTDAGDYSWSYDEYLILCRHIPDEAAAEEMYEAHRQAGLRQLAAKVTQRKLKWVKSGGHTGSDVIKYVSDRGGFDIYRNRICGDWRKPCLYRWGIFLRGYPTVQAAKNAAQNQVDMDDARTDREEEADNAKQDWPIKY